jgi:hypothetical protein
MADVLVLLNPLDVSPPAAHAPGRRRAAARVGRRERARARRVRARQVFVNGHACTDPTYRTHAGDEVLVAFTPGAGVNIGLLIVQALVSMAIGLALQVIFGAKKPAAGNTPQPSQVYGIAPPRNAVRLGQPIPAIYGSVICLPDFAAQPYTVFEGNEQYLHALLCVGLGEYDFSEMLLGADLGLDARPRHRQVGRLPARGARGRVRRDRGADGRARERRHLAGRGRPGARRAERRRRADALDLVLVALRVRPHGKLSRRGRPDGQDHAGAKLAALPQPALGTAVFCTLGFDGSTYTFGTYTAKVYDPAQQPPPGALIPPPTYSQAGQEKWLGYFATCKPGQHGSLLELDFVFRGGLYTGDASGNLANCTVTLTVEAQPIDDAGANAGALQTFTESFVAKDNTPLRYTVKYRCPRGATRCAPSARRNSDLKVSTADHVTWAGLKFQLDPPPVGTPVYGNVTLIAVIMKATNGVASDAASSMRFRVTRRLRRWAWARPWPRSTPPTPSWTS